MANESKLMELAKLLGEWQPNTNIETAIKANDVWEALWGPPQGRRDVDTVISANNSLAGINTELDEKLDQLYEYLLLFRSATGQERNEARKIFLSTAKPINKTFFGAWKPSGYDFAETLSLHLLALAAAYGKDYPRETFPERGDKFATFETAVKAQGLDWLDFSVEFTILAANYYSDVLDVSQLESISEDDFQAELANANQAIAEQAPRPELNYQRGLLYFKHRNFVVAIKDFERAVVMDRKKPEYQYYLGTSYAALGLLDAARNYYMGIMMRFSNFPQNAEIRGYLDEWRNRLRL